jgi:hypothetical protein
MSYGPIPTDAYRQSGGSMPAGFSRAKNLPMPVLQPTKFELVTNLKTAKARIADSTRILHHVADGAISRHSALYSITFSASDGVNAESSVATVRPLKSDLPVCTSQAHLSARSSALAWAMRCSVRVSRWSDLGVGWCPQEARFFISNCRCAKATNALFHCAPGLDRCLLASATIRLASTAKPLPPTRPAPMHAPTTRSNTLRKMPLSRKHSLRARENAE